MSFFSTFLETGPTGFFQPDADQRTDTDLLNRLALMVGLVAFGLPLVLAFGGTVGGSCFRDSISHFYYAHFLGPIFVGLLFFIGGFLIAYTGESFWESVGSNLAGLGAFVVAAIPTHGSGCEMEQTFLSRVFVNVTAGTPDAVAPIDGRGFFNLFGAASDYHALAAGVLFVYLGVYCLVVLKRIVPQRHIQNGALLESKRKRNRWYSYCGLVILACVAVLGLKSRLVDLDSWNAANLTFFIEAVALWAFGLAWFIKGRWFESLNDPGSG